MVKKMEEILAETGELFTTASGVSMLPCIRPKRDRLHLAKPEHDIKKYDVLLYKRKNGTYILHRVLEVKSDSYVLCGDNQWVLEHGITDEQVLGVLRGFYRGKKYIDCQKNRLYHFYVKLWCFSLEIRKLFLRGMNLMRRIGGKLRKSKQNQSRNRKNRLDISR